MHAGEILWTVLIGFTIVGSIASKRACGIGSPFIASDHAAHVASPPSMRPPVAHSAGLPNIAPATESR